MNHASSDSSASLLILRAIRDRLASPRRWVQGTWCAARDESGFLKPFWQLADKRLATCWCLGAALTLAIDGHENDDWTVRRLECEELLLRIVARRGWGTWPNVAHWNDDINTSHRDVLSVVDEAIGELEAA